MSERKQLLASIVKTTADYRVTPTPERVDTWVKQFDAGVQLPILREMDHVLGRTYFSRQSVDHFLDRMLTSKKLVGADPCSFWRDLVFLNIQARGASQSDMLALLDPRLRKLCGIGWKDCGSKKPKTFAYIDDVLCTGNHIRRDLEKWIETDAPAAATLHVITIALHTAGRFFIADKIAKAAQKVSKKIQILWWRHRELETTTGKRDNSDVLWPTELPDDKAVAQYVSGMNHKPLFRKPGKLGSLGIFSSEEGRHLLEQQFLIAGVRIREMCGNLGNSERPLGHMTLVTLGFGSLIVTYRNCPNNAPLALWVDHPWYPLFPRTTNTDTQLKKMFPRIVG